MYKQKSNNLYASDIAKYLQKNINGEDIFIQQPASKDDIKGNSILYMGSDCNKELVSSDIKVLVICDKDHAHIWADRTVIISETPQKDFYKVVNEFFVSKNTHYIHPKSEVMNRKNLGVNVHIGANTFIDEGVIVGNNTVVGNNVSIIGNVVIGDNCLIMDGTVIGKQGFLFVEDEDKVISVPQIGGVEIGNNVWIGANSTIERSFLGKTKISNNVKIDDLVNVGSNANIKENCKITSGVVIARNVELNENTFVGINASIKEDVIIGEKCIIGMGSVVISDTDDNYVYGGIPAKKLNPVI